MSFPTRFPSCITEKLPNINKFPYHKNNRMAMTLCNSQKVKLPERPLRACRLQQLSSFPIVNCKGVNKRLSSTPMEHGTICFLSRSRNKACIVSNKSQQRGLQCLMKQEYTIVNFPYKTDRLHCMGMASHVVGDILESSSCCITQHS